MNVLINGIGNIGTTLLNLIVDNKELLGINKIFALKNTRINKWNKNELYFLTQKNIKICTTQKDEFYNYDEIINQIDYIFDTTANSLGLKNKEIYENINNLTGCSAQGSEKGFGIPYMSDVNNNLIFGEKFAQVVSCNTHSLAALLLLFSQNNTDNIINSDFVIVRRSDDLANHKKLVSANVISRHRDTRLGTHHAIDVNDLFKTNQKYIPIQSSDITTPSQLMHTVRFNITLKNSISSENINHFIQSSSYISSTNKYDSNIIFDLGRRYSPYGRIYSHAIIADNNLMIKDNTITGWAFIPQEGSSILSTIHSYLLQTGNTQHIDIMKILIGKYIIKEW